ncbi:hypothetical protein [Streptomyces sp. NPDC002265]|uniref:hypothetical protein n=1 Tax=Streptomyces sp. NPDC002265 TaxID=3154415 RepID=UPI00331C8421
MNTRTAACLALLALAALTGCSSGGDDKPEPPASTAATVTQTVDQAAARAACVSAWADVIQTNPDAGVEDEPGACDGLPEDDRLDRYMEGLQQRNQANRDKVADCLADPSCTSLPVP